MRRRPDVLSGHGAEEKEFKQRAHIIYGFRRHLEGRRQSVTSTPMPGWLVGLSAAGGENFLRLGAREKRVRARPLTT